jgi:hypothetical protein
MLVKIRACFEELEHVFKIRACFGMKNRIQIIQKIAIISMSVHI